MLSRARHRIVVVSATAYPRTPRLPSTWSGRRQVFMKTAPGFSAAGEPSAGVTTESWKEEGSWEKSGGGSDGLRGGTKRRWHFGALVVGVDVSCHEQSIPYRVVVHMLSTETTTSSNERVQLYLPLLHL